MVEVGAATYGTQDMAVIVERMNSAPENFYRSKEHVLDFARATVGRAKEAMPRFFGRLPATDVEGVSMPAESSSTPNDAYYREGSAREQRPGRYYIGTKEAETTSLISGESTAFHEAIPGHHFQLTIADELPARPEYLRSMWSTAFVEGWALYGERLADEAGLYSTPAARFGMLGWQAVRAARLVVDTGLHAKGWTREQAVTFFMESTPMKREEAEGQIDRYISYRVRRWPTRSARRRSPNFARRRSESSAHGSTSARSTTQSSARAPSSCKCSRPSSTSTSRRGGRAEGDQGLAGRCPYDRGFGFSLGSCFASASGRSADQVAAYPCPGFQMSQPCEPFCSELFIWSATYLGLKLSCLYDMP
ncbi:MAG: DUF885 domain-containing protein [Myxococcales bacterium]|nr:DUF885 domain-containing protein [Myxococcales bacterium]